MTFLADVNCPRYQKDLVNNWEPACSLVGDAISGAMLALRLLALAARLPASLPLVGGGLVCNRLTLLWYSLNPLFREQAQQCLRLELFAAKFSLSLFFFSLPLSIPQFGLLSHISFLRLSLGHSGPVLTLSMQLCLSVQPLLAGGRREHLGCFSAGSCS